MENVMKTMRKIPQQITSSPGSMGALLMLLLFSCLLMLPGTATASVISCSSGVSGCHFKPTVKDGTGRNVPDGLFIGSHARHSGYSTGTKRQYQMACIKCHGLSSGYNNAHQSGFKNVSGSSLPGNRYSGGKKIANTNNPAFGNCSQIYCHSTGRATGMGQVQYSSSRWGGTEGCLGCHGGRNGASGNYARSVGNFTLSTTHSQHLKYPAANVTCNECHSRTAMDAATLKPFSAATRHVNGVRDVTFASNATYGSYTSYKSTEVGSSANTKVCTNTSCHGGTTRSAWSATIQNTDNTCVHCHGTAGTVTGLAVTGANRYNLRFFAPGWPKNSQGAANAGISTDGVSVNTNDRVGAHFVHLSSAYMKNLKCNECHAVPSTPFEGTHMATSGRYNSQTLTFAQASTAIKNTTTPAKVDGTALAAATCTTTYCHGSKMPKGDTSGSTKSPAWDNATLMTGSPGADCGTCHGNPPTAGTTAGTHSGKTATTSCSGCHSFVDATGKIIDKSKHLDGSITATGGHARPYQHYNLAGALAPATNCSCHDYTSTSGTYPNGSPGNYVAPACRSCHVNAAPSTSSSTQCSDCHGNTATTGTPNGGTGTFPNWSGSHTAHINAGYTCSKCHFNGGTGAIIHGYRNHSTTIRSGTLGTRQAYVNVNGNGAFTYTASSMTCANVTGCHGTAVWSTTVMDCTTCHGAAFTNTRSVTADFTGKSHHVTSGTLTKWHCIICHAEGNPSSGGTTSLHKNGTVDLRNVDNVSTATNGGTAGANYWSIAMTAPTKPSATDATNIDNFCFGCHDSVGSAGIAYNGTNTITTGLTTTQQQKPFNDNLTNSYDAIGRSRVIDVSTQFTTTNYSHHAVKAAKYSAAGGLPFNTTTIIAGGNVDDNSRLHCHDCHYFNGHGTANNEYMLQNSTGADTLHTASTYVCLKCHTSTYSTNGHTAGNGSDFVNGRSGNYNVTGISCTACHNTGGMMWGGIHGGNYTYTVGTSPGWTATGSTGSGQSTYRFMPGMANNGYSPANWTAASAAITCYTNPNASWSACTSHTGGKSATVTRAGGARALSY